MEIDDWRRKIDEIDLQILHLISERAECSIAIGHIKNDQNLPIYSPERERWILNRLIQENQGPLTADGVRRIFERIIDENRKLEKDESEKKKE